MSEQNTSMEGLGYRLRDGFLSQVRRARSSGVKVAVHPDEGCARVQFMGRRISCLGQAAMKMAGYKEPLVMGVLMGQTVMKFMHGSAVGSGWGSFHESVDTSVGATIHFVLMDAELSHGLAFFDAGDEVALRSWVKEHPGSALLPFIAENPIRRGTLPENILTLARTILEAGSDEIDLTLATVSSGRIPRECGVQLALIDALRLRSESKLRHAACAGTWRIRCC
jgi:hypothetical protein